MQVSVKLGSYKRIQSPACAASDIKAIRIVKPEAGMGDLEIDLVDDEGVLRTINRVRSALRPDITPGMMFALIQDMGTPQPVEVVLTPEEFFSAFTQSEPSTTELKAV